MFSLIMFVLPLHKTTFNCSIQWFLRPYRYLDSPLIIFALLWNLWFSKIFCHTCCSNVFFTFNMSFLKKSKHGTFRFFFYFWASNDQLALLPKIKNCRYLCSFYHKSAFDLVHQYWLVHLNKYQLVNVNTLKTCSKTFDMCKSKIWQ